MIAPLGNPVAPARFKTICGQDIPSGRLGEQYRWVTGRSVLTCFGREPALAAPWLRETAATRRRPGRALPRNLDRFRGRPVAVFVSTPQRPNRFDESSPNSRRPATDFSDRRWPADGFAFWPAVGRPPSAGSAAETAFAAGADVRSGRSRARPNQTAATTAARTARMARACGQGTIRSSDGMPSSLV